MTRKALIIGPGGRFGRAMAQDLHEGGWELTLMSRTPDRLSRQVQALGTTVQGDALNEDQLAVAASGHQAIIQGLNVPYQKWPDVLEQATRTLVRAGEKTGAHILFPGNIYGYGPDDGYDLTEETPTTAITKKGRIRIAQEHILAKAARSGRCKIIILRAGDFFGPHAPDNWFHQLVSGPLNKGRIVYPGPLNVPHAWAYLPDMAATGRALLDRMEELDDFEVFHFRGYQITGQDLIDAVHTATGRSDLRVKAFPWRMLALVSPFVPMIRELREMKYLWEAPHELKDRKLRKFIGDVPHTPLVEAIRQILGS